VASDAAPRTLVVTGAAGYVGGVVVRELLASPGSVVIGVDSASAPHGAEGVRELIGNERFRFVRADVRDGEGLSPMVAEADAVVHLAAIVGDPAGRRDPDLTREVNVGASRVVADLCAASPRRPHLVFVSTCSNYGISGTDDLVAEDVALNPTSLYAETKVEVERMLADRDEVRSTVLRLATVYGVAPRMRFDLTVNQFAIEAFRSGRLEIYGEQFWRPYVHVGDVARAVVAVLDAPGASVGRTFNVGDSSENYTKRMIADVIRERVPRLEVHRVAVDEDPRSYRVDFSRIAGELGYAVTRRVPDGVDEVLRLAALGVFPDPFGPAFRN
jgi:nucleoside-diphosphate-sugar epimerase